MYKSESRRVSRRRNRISDGDAIDAVEEMSGGQKFKVIVFFVIMDKLKTALRTRIEVYSVVFQRFGFLTEHDDMTDEENNISTSRLVEAYSND